MNTKHTHDDTDAFLEKLEYEASRPDDEFRAQLKRTMLESYSRTSDSVFTKLLKGVQKVDIKTILGKWPANKRYAAAGVFLLVVVAAGSATGYSVYRSRNYTQALSGSEKTDILSRLASITGTRDTYSSEESALLQGAAADLSMPAPWWLENDYAYSKRITTVTDGPAAGQCPAMASQEEGRTESYSYNDEISYYSKYIMYDKSGDLYEYSLYTPEYRIEYKGGDFAIKTLENNEKAVLYEDLEARQEDAAVESERGLVEVEKSPAGSAGEEDSSPTRQTVTTNVEIADTEPVTGESSEDVPVSIDLIEPLDIPEPEQDIEPGDESESMFGPDAQVEEIVKGGKLVQYLVTWTYSSYCDEQVFMRDEAVSSQVIGIERGQISEDQGYTIVQKTWYDAENMEIVRDESYLNSVAPANLIQTTVTESVLEDTEFENVQGDFGFEYQVEIKTIDPSQYTFEPYTNEEDRAEYINAAIDKLQQGKTAVLRPASAQFVSLVFNMFDLDLEEDPYEQYYLDRSYYSAGTRGDEQYAQARQAYEQAGDYLLPVMEQTFSNDTPETSESLTIAVFGPEVSSAEILDDHLGLQRDKTTQEEVEIMIDGVSISSTKYIEKLEYETLERAILYEERDPGAEGMIEPDMIEPEVTVQSEEIIYYLFSFSGHSYLIHSFTEESSSAALAFDSYDPDTSQGEAKIRELVEESYDSIGRERLEDIMVEGGQDTIVE